MGKLLDKYSNKTKLESYRKAIKSYQEGGQMMAPQGAPAPEAAPAPQGGGGDIMALLEQYAQTKDPQIAVQIADTLLAMAAQDQGAVPAARQGGLLRKPRVFRK